MKKINKILLRSIFFVSVLLLMSTSSYADTCTSNANGDWHVAEN